MTSAELYLVVVATLLLLGVAFLVYRQLKAQAPVSGPTVEEVRALEAKAEGALDRLKKANEQLEKVNQSANQIEPTEGDPNGTT